MVYFDEPVFITNKDELWFNQWELLIFCTMYERALKKQKKYFDADYQEIFHLEKWLLLSKVVRQDPKFVPKKIPNLLKKIKMFEVNYSTKKPKVEIKMSEKVFNDFRDLYENPMKGYYWTPEEL